MSQERDVQTPDGTAFKFDASLSKAEIKAKIAAVLDRGVTSDRTNVQGDLPPGIHAEWVVDDPNEIVRMQMMGFEFDTEIGKGRGIHNDGTGRTKIGDVVLMTCPMVVKEAIDEHIKMQFEKKHGKPGQNNLREEQQYVNDSRGAAEAGHIKLVADSEVKNVSGDDIKQQLKG